MAYINVYDWKSDQVIEWLKGKCAQSSREEPQLTSNRSFIAGVEGITNPYIKAFANNQIDGIKLLNLRPYELEELGIDKVGHQEIILEAVELLKNFVRDIFYFYRR